MRGHLWAAALGAAAALFPAAGRAECPPIQVVLEGSVTTEREGQPVSNYPITVRMQGQEGGLPTLRWEAVVTGRDGRFRWARAFAANPCYDAIFLLDFPRRIWGRLRHPWSDAYRRHALDLPHLIVLNAGKEVRRIERARLLDAFDPEARTAQVEVNFAL
jgi:hypothetical protein